MKYTLKLNSNKDFVGLYKKGKYIVGRSCAVYFRKNGRNVNRLGISTGKKIGGAVERNRARRVIRQAYREAEDVIPKGYDIVIAARADAVKCKSYSIRTFLEKKVAGFMSGEK